MPEKWKRIYSLKLNRKQKERAEMDSSTGQKIATDFLTLMHAEQQQCTLKDYRGRGMKFNPKRSLKFKNVDGFRFRGFGVHE